MPITPCRVFDTRTGIGPQHGPLGPDQAVTFPITGDQGECSGIPAAATAVALNVTALDATAWSFLTIWPSDTAKPNASSLNYVPGQGPTPNGVIADLSAGGTIDVHPSRHVAPLGERASSSSALQVGPSDEQHTPRGRPRGHGGSTPRGSPPVAFG